MMVASATKQRDGREPQERSLSVTDSRWPSSGVTAPSERNAAENGYSSGRGASPEIVIPALTRAIHAACA